jgi:subtilisin family serine protease
MGKFSKTLGNLHASPTVERAVPVFRVGSNQVVVTDRINVGFDSDEVKANFLSKHELEAVEQWEGGAMLRLPDGVDVFDFLEALDGEPGIGYAEPDFVTIGRHIPTRIGAALTPVLGDPLVQGQYAMQITNARDAWAIVSGDSNIKIAILDEGVDTSHPDLKAAVVASFDGADSDNFQEPNRWDGHGTACAGLAAAVPNNGIGVRGVGGGCSIIAVRIAYSEKPDGGWITKDSWIRRSIEFAWQSGASVISNSWGGGTPSSMIAQEFERARTRGRNGLGCVIVIAAGNNHGPVSFPATLPNVLAVSATNEYDEAKTPTSKDGENWWGTNHGPEISVGAPGVHNLTTDISGGAGYDPTNYTKTFNGTSSATPIVAGACGLILSANANLTERQVRDIVTATADKVGPYPYQNNRNKYFGNGRLNVLRAVQAAQNA